MGLISIRLSSYDEQLLAKLVEEENKGRKEILRDGLYYKYQQRGLLNSVTEIEDCLRKLIGTVLAATESARERADINDEIHENITFTRIALEHLVTGIAPEVVSSIDSRFTEFKGLKAKNKRKSKQEE